eukprot:8758596-Heterocapsa_arctica.AAC.1
MEAPDQKAVADEGSTGRSHTFDRRKDGTKNRSGKNIKEAELEAVKHKLALQLSKTAEDPRCRRKEERATHEKDDEEAELEAVKHNEAVDHIGCTCQKGSVERMPSKEALQEKEAKEAELEAVKHKGENVAGLGDWLRGLQLQKYEKKAEDWCEDMGSASLEEVTDDWEALADALGLKPHERKRIAKERDRAAAEVAAEDADTARKAEERRVAAEGTGATRKAAKQNTQERMDKRASRTQAKRDKAKDVEAERKDIKDRIAAEVAEAARKEIQAAEAARNAEEERDRKYEEAFGDRFDAGVEAARRCEVEEEAERQKAAKKTRNDLEEGRAAEAAEAAQVKEKEEEKEKRKAKEKEMENKK